jgi:MFS family permease
VALGAWAQAVTRFFADPFVERFSPTAVARILLGALGAGVLLVFFAPSGWLALVGFALMGIGTSVIFPLAMSAAAQLTDRPHLASLAQVSFVAFLLGPPLLGYIAEYFGVRWVVRHRATAGYPEHRLRRGAGHQTAEARG